MSANEIEMNNKINKISEDLNNVKKDITSIKLTYQQAIPSNKPIPPGVSTKVYYDSKGLVIQSGSLSETDIPELTIDKVRGLRKELDKIGTAGTYSKKDTSRSTQVHKFRSGTGTKITVDENGMISSMTDLIVSDIPKLPINHIDGLGELLNNLDMVNSTDNIRSNIIDDYNINPGTYAKITYNNDGRVVSGSNLSMGDIPIEVSNRLNNMESKMLSFVDKHELDVLKQDVYEELLHSEYMIPGTFTKVDVNSKGIITAGSGLELKDLPRLKIRDIELLEDTLSNMVDYDSYLTLQSRIRSIEESSGSAEISSIKLQVSSKVSSHQFSELHSQVQHISNKLDNVLGEILSKIADDFHNEVQFLRERILELENKK